MLTEFPTYSKDVLHSLKCQLIWKSRYLITLTTSIDMSWTRSPFLRTYDEERDEYTQASLTGQEDTKISIPIMISLQECSQSNRFNCKKIQTRGLACCPLEFGGFEQAANLELQLTEQSVSRSCHSGKQSVHQELINIDRNLLIKCLRGSSKQCTKCLTI